MGKKNVTPAPEPTDEMKRRMVEAFLLEAVTLVNQAADAALKRGATEIAVDGFTLAPGGTPALSVSVTWPEEEETVDDLLS